MKRGTNLDLAYVWKNPGKTVKSTTCCVWEFLQKFSSTFLQRAAWLTAWTALFDLYNVTDDLFALRKSRQKQPF